MDKKLVIDNRAFIIASAASKAMLYEAACFPSPGLVSPVCNGAHRDMDFFTFIDSSAAIYKYLVMFAQEGLKDESCKSTFQKIRLIGIDCEKAMLGETMGVNTHKGLIFLLGIGCAAVSKAVRERRGFKDIKAIIREMTEGIVERELGAVSSKSILSHGEQLYLKYGVKGIRQQVEEGLPMVFDYSLAYFKSLNNLKLNDKLVSTLIFIMQYCEDTNIIYRNSPKVLREVQSKAREIIEIGCMGTEAGRNEITLLNEEFIKRNISPGGSADLLAVTIFFSMIESLLF